LWEKKEKVLPAVQKRNFGAGGKKKKIQILSGHREEERKKKRGFRESAKQVKGSLGFFEGKERGGRKGFVLATEKGEKRTRSSLVACPKGRGMKKGYHRKKKKKRKRGGRGGGGGGGVGGGGWRGGGGGGCLTVIRNPPIGRWDGRT